MLASAPIGSVDAVCGAFLTSSAIPYCYVVIYCFKFFFTCGGTLEVMERFLKFTPVDMFMFASFPMII